MAADDDALKAIQDWLTERLAAVLRIDRDSIALDAPFSEYGLDSLDAVTLVSDLEDLLDAELPPTLLWDHPTVRACAAYLGEESDVPPIRSQSG